MKIVGVAVDVDLLMCFISRSVQVGLGSVSYVFLELFEHLMTRKFILSLVGVLRVYKLMTHFIVLTVHEWTFTDFLLNWTLNG